MLYFSDLSVSNVSTDVAASVLNATKQGQDERLGENRLDEGHEATTQKKREEVKEERREAKRSEATTTTIQNIKIEPCKLICYVI